MEVAVSRARSAYTPHRVPVESAIASLLFKKTTCLSRIRKYRTSVPFRQPQKGHDVEGLGSVP